jgi:hypothetical protein
MESPDVLSNAVVQFLQSPPPGSRSKQSMVYILGRVTAGAPDHDVFTLCVPLED